MNRRTQVTSTKFTEIVSREGHWERNRTPPRENVVCHPDGLICKWMAFTLKSLPTRLQILQFFLCLHRSLLLNESCFQTASLPLHPPSGGRGAKMEPQEIDNPQACEEKEQTSPGSCFIGCSRLPQLSAPPPNIAVDLRVIAIEFRCLRLAGL
ncbi:hypothetical protein AVEN_5446-1 [Araneus ventricosus]|uniref:Uncharacterized protein n=1 Tax=Araneus ventricosus TaxID=182803 RepID=A0A4Y2DZP7_ARAVE|nr:hypothetical protein AVEN_5446-1 [Araneus ventricosus]